MSHDTVKPSFERNDDRGFFQEILNDGHWENLIRGRMNPGAVIGNHYHKKTIIFFYLTSGSVRVKTVNVENGLRDDFALQANQGVLLSVNESHAIRFLEDSEFIMLKSLRYDSTDPDTYSFPVED
jgi:dTDP-4-dehydrorhamnose 3,5-epimerase-like enzyme